MIEVKSRSASCSIEAHAARLSSLSRFPRRQVQYRSYRYRPFRVCLPLKPKRAQSQRPIIGQQMLKSSMTANDSISKRSSVESIEQAKRQAQWLSKWLSSAVGDLSELRPVLALPGWFVERVSGDGIPVDKSQTIPFDRKTKQGKCFIRKLDYTNCTPDRAKMPRYRTWRPNKIRKGSSETTFTYGEQFFKIRSLQR